MEPLYYLWLLYGVYLQQLGKDPIPFVRNKRNLYLLLYFKYFIPSLFYRDFNRSSLKLPFWHEKISPYLKGKGFEILDNEAKLYTFIADRINDQKPSVVVFAFPIIPKKIIGNIPDKWMMRQYLSTGGKVLFMGDIPNFYELDEKGNFKSDFRLESLLLGVEYLDSNEFGNYYSKTTQQGLNRGIPTWLKNYRSHCNSKWDYPFWI